MTTAQSGADEDLAALREVVRDLVRGSGGLAAARSVLDVAPGSSAGFDERAWRLLGQDMGLAGLGVPEARGGAGAGLPELTLVAEELGRALLPVPFLSSTVLAGQVLSRCPADGAAEVVEQLAAGVVVAFAGTDADGCWRPDRLTVSADATQSGDGTWQLTGTVPFVLDGAAAAYLVVVAQTPDGGDVFVVPGEGDGVQRRALEVLDATRAQAEITFAGAPARALTSGGTGAALVGAALDVALVVLAAEQVGGAAACLDMATDYAKLRHQFSRPIGSFQAIKHKLADLLLLVELGRSAIDRALLAQDDPAALAEAAAVAQIWCSRRVRRRRHRERARQRGHRLHLGARRASVLPSGPADKVLLGGPSVHRERLAQLLSW